MGEGDQPDPTEREAKEAAARALEREVALEVDAELVADLERAGCRGRLWEFTARRLAALGTGALHARILDGRILRDARDLGRPLSMRPEDLDALCADRDLRAELVNEAVAKGLDLFRRRAVMSGRWTVSGGASLDVYFVNGCVMSLTNPVRAWVRARRTEQRTEVRPPGEIDGPTRADGRPTSPDPADELLAHEDTAAVLDLLGPVLGKAVLLKVFTGWPWDTVATEIGLTPKALEQRLRRFRRRYDSRPEEDDTDA